MSFPGEGSLKQKESARKCVNNVLKGLAEFGVIIEIDPKTYEVLGVELPKEKTYVPPLGSIK